MAPVFGDENGNKAMVEETHQVFAPKLRGKFPLLFTKLFSMLCLFLGCLAATMGVRKAQIILYDIIFPQMTFSLFFAKTRTVDFLP